MSTLVRLFAFATLAGSLVISVYAFTLPANPTGYVNDYGEMLSQSSREALSSRLALFTASTTHQIAVVTVPALGSDDTIETLGIKIADTWHVGNSKNDNGVIFVISRDDREARIEVGYGLEGVLTDSISARILEESVFPKFKAGDYDGGIQDGVSRIMGVISGEVMSPSITSSSFLKNNTEMIVFGLLWVLLFLAEFLARSRTWWQGGVIGAVLGSGFGFIFHTGLSVALGAIALGVLGLLIDYVLSKAGPFSTGTGGGMTPAVWGGFGGSSRSSSSFGGFGGGSFGGGGSSGNW